jgi:hypothetical protein
VRIELAVLGRRASLKYTRPAGLPKEKVFARDLGASFARNGRREATKKVKHRIRMF